MSNKSRNESDVHRRHTHLLSPHTAPGTAMTPPRDCTTGMQTLFPSLQNHPRHRANCTLQDPTQHAPALGLSIGTPLAPHLGLYHQINNKPLPTPHALRLEPAACPPSTLPFPSQRPASQEHLHEGLSTRHGAQCFTHMNSRHLLQPSEWYRTNMSLQPWEEYVISILHTDEGIRAQRA